MFKNLKNISLFSIIVITTIIGMEPEATKNIAAKSFVKRSQQQKKSNYSFTESSSEEVPSGEVSDACSFEETNPLSHLFETKPFKLADYNNKGGSVLPVYTGPEKKLYAILTREARGKEKGKYDDFSGGREKEDKHPMLSAAREFHEEAILQRTLQWDLDQTIEFLDPEKTENTMIIVAYSKDKNPNISQAKEAKNVTYIVNFDKYEKQLFNNFYKALDAEKKYYRENRIPRREQSTVEKDRIAAVQIDILKEAIINSKSGKPVVVSANVVDPKTNKFRKDKITLRPFLVAKLRPYFLDMPYYPGEHEKIRHYRISFQQ